MTSDFFSAADIDFAMWLRSRLAWKVRQEKFVRNRATREKAKYDDETDRLRVTLSHHSPNTHDQTEARTA